MKPKPSPFESLSIEEKQQVPVIYPLLKAASKGATTFIPSKSKHHRSDGFNIQMFHRPVSLVIDYDEIR